MFRAIVLSTSTCKLKTASWVPQWEDTYFMEEEKAELEICSKKPYVRSIFDSSACREDYSCPGRSKNRPERLHVHRAPRLMYGMRARMTKENIGRHLRVVVLKTSGKLLAALQKDVGSGGTKEV